jgi:hypothetical protein
MPRKALPRGFRGKTFNIHQSSLRFASARHPTSNIEWEGNDRMEDKGGYAGQGSQKEERGKHRTHPSL